MKARLTASLMVIATLLLVAPGCGGDEEGSTSSGGQVKSSSLSHEEFVKQASAECRRERNGLLKETVAFAKKDPEKNESVKAIVDKVLLPKIETETEIIRSLGAPEGDEEEIEAILAGQEKAIEEARQLQDPESIIEVETYFEDVSEMMREYGFTECMSS